MNGPSLRFRVIPCLLLATCGLLTIGCRDSSEIVHIEYQPNFVHAYKHGMKEGFQMDQVLEDANRVVTEAFGTYDAPKLPQEILAAEDIEGVISQDNLLVGQKLYQQKLCYTCHGFSGDGRGVNANQSMPYPRDYRMGVFKFKSTKRNAKPTREDLGRLIKGGIAGTTMVALPNLSDDQLEALIDYVIYLSWRGELERALIDEAVFAEQDIEGGLHIFDPTSKDSTDEDLQDLYAEGQDLIVEFIADIGGSWLDAEDEVVEVEIPDDMPIPASNAEFREMLKGEQAEALKASVARGQEIFRGKIAACNKCHGNEGKGDGTNTDYDDWTKDWTVQAGLKPEDRDTLIPLLARGAMTPQTIKPRNFSEGTFRGGGAPEDLYRRITVGIAGTPMPAVTFVPGEFEEHDVWHIINFVRSLDQSGDEEEKGQPVAEQPAA